MHGLSAHRLLDLGAASLEEADQWRDAARVDYGTLVLLLVRRPGDPSEGEAGAGLRGRDTIEQQRDERFDGTSFEDRVGVTAMVHLRNLFQRSRRVLLHLGVALHHTLHQLLDQGWQSFGTGLVDVLSCDLFPRGFLAATLCGLGARGDAVRRSHLDGQPPGGRGCGRASARAQESAESPKKLGPQQDGMDRVG
jgi:hypothetical protein